jgi:hypothetical protein
MIEVAGIVIFRNVMGHATVLKLREDDGEVVQVMFYDTFVKDNYWRIANCALGERVRVTGDEAPDHPLAPIVVAKSAQIVPEGG